MSSLDLTRRWLRRAVLPYANQEIVYDDVDSTLTTSASLKPKVESYTYDDGRVQNLLCIHGLLAISFKQAAYNIPISIWIPFDYPNGPPIVYVVPTSDMVVKSGKYVDVSGKCDIPYLHNWERKSQGSNLKGLLLSLQDQFSRQPPLYAKPRVSPGSSQPVSPPPSTPTASVPRPLPVEIRSPPPLPPGPMPILGPAMQPQYQAPQLQPLPHQVQPPQTLSHPHQLQPPHMLPPPHQLHVPHMLSPPNLRLPLPLQVPHPLPELQPYRPPQSFRPTQPLQVAQQFTQTPSMHQPSTDHFPRPAQPQPLPRSIPAPQPNFLDMENMESDPAALEQAVPPRPPNPELVQLHEQVYRKITSELSTMGQALSADSERLRATQTDLLAGEPAIRDEMGRLEAVRDVCRAVAGRLTAAVEKGEANVQELKNKGDPDVDELVCSTTIVFNQLLNLVAEDNAIEDTIYHLHRALNSGRIDLERFLRTTRILAEQQFMKRALIEKISSGIPIGMSLGWS